ncbi:AI-2E family transporter [Planctomicrobium sp. SH661]|uniref:AI-2E family transporter n=1 Tax=Planctomicrobium sp. SH661 TaxID=3448124 RepID=UPI003F5B4814
MSTDVALQERNAMTSIDSPPPIELTVVSLVVLATIAVVTVMALLGPVIIPVLTAIFLFFIIRPATNRLLRWNVPRWLTYVLLVAGLSGVVYLLSHLIYQDAEKFTQQLPAMQEKSEALLKRIPWAGPDPLDSDTITEFFNLKPGEVFQNMFGTAWRFTESIILVLFYLIFVLLDADRLPQRMRIAFPKQGATLVRAFEKISDGISRYMRVKTLISLGMAASVAVILVSFGVSNWLLWAFLTFLLNYITYIGSLLALIPPILLSLLQFDHLTVWLILVGLLFLNRFIWIDFLEIRHTGKQLRINNVLLLFSIVFWGWFWGITGMVLAVPMLSALRIILAQFDSTRSWAVLISED